MLIILYLRLLIFLVVSIPLVHPLSTTSFVSIKRPFTDLPMNVVEGSIPKWLKGDYIRNGPGLFEAGNKRLNHLFDGYGMLVKVAFDPSSPPQVSTRFIESDAYRAAAAGKMAYPEFGTTRNWEEDAGFMEKVQAFIQVISGDPTDNAVVNVLRLGDGTQVRLHLERSDCKSIAPPSYITSNLPLVASLLAHRPNHFHDSLRSSQLALTETARGTFQVSADNLATEKRFAFSGADVGQLQTAHPMPDGTGGWINVGTEVGSLSGSYNVFRFGHLPNDPTRRELICRVPAAVGIEPRWQHSFAVTKRHVVLIEQPVPYDLPSMLGLSLNPKYACVKWLSDQVRLGEGRGLERSDTSISPTTITKAGAKRQQMRHGG